jgi:phosphotransferase system IIA component
MLADMILVSVVEGVTAPLTQVQSAVFAQDVGEGTIFLG